MEVVDRIATLQARLERDRRQGRVIGLVPTMGFIHDGHLALVERAASSCDRVVVSIFVNPTQFGPGEDFEAYPRDLAGDLRKLERLPVDVVFAPPVGELYPEPLQTSVEVSPLGDILIGAQRAGHFRGVATVVSKLFNIVCPHQAFFGEKDYQQLTVIRKMVADLSMPVEIVGVPTVREADGLAMSSRNVRLHGADRAAATVLSRALDEGQRLIEEGTRSVEGVLSALRDMIGAEPRATLNSVDIRDAATLAGVDRLGREPLVILIAATLGGVLLIDQRVAAPTSDLQQESVGA